MDCLHDITNVRNLCLVCLTEGSQNISLEDVFQKNRKDSPSVLVVLETVMSKKLKLYENYPSEICSDCLSILKISYDLREQYQNSQKILKEHFTKCLEDMEENDDSNTLSPPEFLESEENDLLTPKLEVDDNESTYDEITENVEYVYEENIEKLEEYLHLKTDQEYTEQPEEESGFNQNDYIEEYNDSNDKIDKTIQINATSYKINKELQIRQLDIDKYIIENPVKNSALSFTMDHDVNLSSLDEELIQAAYNLKYECPGCPKVYSSLRKLDKHKETCMRLKRLERSQSAQPATINEGNKDEDVLSEEDSLLLYECDQCVKYYHTSDELEQHKELRHSESKLNVYEEFKLEDLSQLDQELFKGALLLRHECNNCPKVYSSSDKLEKHKVICEKLKRRYSKKSKAGAKVIATQLDGEGDESIKLVEGVCLENLPHAEREIFQNALNLYHKCPNCDKFYSSEDRFKRHLMNCEAKRANVDVYSCEICGHISTSKKNDFYHKQTAHQEKKYACEKCGKLFATNTILKQHMQTHAKDKTKVVCPICGKGFHYSSGLFYHMKMHRKELNYLCDYCDRRFLNLNGLKRHLATHTGERAYHCRICEKKFKGSTELKIHELRHTDNRPHICDYCSKGYSSKSNLQYHIITHKGDVPCDRCKRKFLNVDVLQLHMKIKHRVQQENPFSSS